LEDALTYVEQSVTELDTFVGEPVNILMNGTLFARGRVMTIDESFGVQVLEIIDSTREAEHV